MMTRCRSKGTVLREEIDDLRVLHSGTCAIYDERAICNRVPTMTIIDCYGKML